MECETLRQAHALYGWVLVVVALAGLASVLVGYHRGPRWWPYRWVRIFTCTSVAISVGQAAFATAGLVLGSWVTVALGAFLAAFYALVAWFGVKMWRVTSK